jgi:hypothetical protein
MEREEIEKIIENINKTGNIIAGYQRNGVKPCTPLPLEYDLCDVNEDGSSFFFQYNYMNIIVEKNEYDIYKITMIDGDFNRKELILHDVETFKEIKLEI